jgi:hypothetical protein
VCAIAETQRKGSSPTIARRIHLGSAIGTAGMKLSNSSYCRLICGLIVGLDVAAEIMSPANSGAAPLRLLLPSFFYPASWSVLIFLLIVATRRDRKIFGVMTGCLAAAGALVGWARGGSASDIGWFYGVALGFSPYLFMAYRIARNSGVARSEWIDILAAASLIHMASLGNNFFRDQTVDLLPAVLDRGIASLDEAFGVQFSGAMAHILTSLPPLNSMAWAAYNFVQIPIVVVAAFQFKRPGADGLVVLPSFIIASIIGYTCYWLAPAVGPKVMFGPEFPLLHATPAFLSSLPTDAVYPGHPRNAMPSLHFTWAMLVFLYTRGLPIWARIVAATFPFLTACATLGFGEHYVIDLIAAAPLILLARALCAESLGWASVERMRSVAAGLAMLAFWIAIVHFGVIPPAALVVIVALATVAASAWLERALARAEDDARLPMANPRTLPDPADDFASWAQPAGPRIEGRA